MRQFQVLVFRPKTRRSKGHWMGYPDMPGEKALALARKIEARGFKVSLYTNANDVGEYMTPSELAQVLEAT